MDRFPSAYMHDPQGMESYARLNADKKRATAINALTQSGAQVQQANYNFKTPNKTKGLLNFSVPGDEPATPPQQQQAKQPTSRRERILSGFTPPDIKVWKFNVAKKINTAPTAEYSREAI